MNQPNLDQPVRLPVFCHSVIDDLPMTLEAFRMYGHLARKWGNGKKGALGSYADMAEHCFRASYPKASSATLRRKAIGAIAELQELGLITKIRRNAEDRSNLANQYVLHDVAMVVSAHQGSDNKVVSIHQGRRDDTRMVPMHQDSAIALQEDTNSEDTNSEDTNPPTPLGKGGESEEGGKEEFSEQQIPSSVTKEESKVLVEVTMPNRADQGSVALPATVENALTFFPPSRDVQSYGKPRLKQGSGFRSQQEIDEFYGELKLLGRSLGKTQAAGWAITIIKGINDDCLPCEYLDEFRSGVPLGSSEQEEWEVQPGQPWPQFVTYLKIRFRRNDLSEEQAIALAFRELRDRNKAAELWDCCKRWVKHIELQWQQQKALGVDNAYVPPELLPADVPSFEEISGAMGRLIEGAQGTAPQMNELPQICTTPLVPAPAEMDEDEQFQVMLDRMRSHIQSRQVGRMKMAERWAFEHPDVKVVYDEGIAVDLREVPF